MMEKQLYALLADRDCEMMLRSLLSRPSSPKVLSDKLGIPISKCYRVLSSLESSSIVGKRILDISGREVSIFFIKEEQISIEVNGIKSRVRLDSLLNLSDAMEKRLRAAHD